MNLEKMALAKAFALTAAIAWVVCSAFVFLLPNLSMTITSWWVHGLNLSPLGSFKLDLVNFLLGGITLTLSFWGVGYIFGWSWERMSKK